MMASRKVSVSICTTAIAAAAMIAFTTTAALAVDAEALWAKNCASCHGKDGKGSKAGEKMGVEDLTSPAKKAKIDAKKVEESMTIGVKAKDSDKMVMKSYKDKLTPEEIKALTDYTLALK